MSNSPRLRRRVCPEQLDLGRSLLQVAERRLRSGRGAGLAVDREVEVEAVLERPSEHGAAVETCQVDVSAREAVESVGEAARAVRRDKRERALRSSDSIPRASWIAALHYDEPRAVLGVVLDRFGKYVQAVPLCRRTAGDRRR